MGETLRLTASDGAAITAYKAGPEGTPRAAVVVVQEVFGLNRYIRATVDRFAAQGYLAIAPAMQDRFSPGYMTDEYGPEAFAKAKEFFGVFRPQTALLDVAAAIEDVRPAGKVGITGYCFGGMITWRAAHAGMGLSAASGYYGGGIPSYIDLAPTIPIEMHYGDKDTGIPVEQVEQLRARYSEVPVYLYPGAHGFCNFDRPQNYDRDSAELAFSRTLAFFKQHLG